jgi:hypothetical protein
VRHGLKSKGQGAEAAPPYAAPDARAPGQEAPRAPAQATWATGYLPPAWIDDDAWFRLYPHIAPPAMVPPARRAQTDVLPLRSLKKDVLAHRLELEPAAVRQLPGSVRPAISSAECAKVTCQEPSRTFLRMVATSCTTAAIWNGLWTKAA